MVGWCRQTFPVVTDTKLGDSTFHEQIAFYVTFNGSLFSVIPSATNSDILWTIIGCTREKLADVPQIWLNVPL